MVGMSSRPSLTSYDSTYEHMMRELSSRYADQMETAYWASAGIPLTAHGNLHIGWAYPPIYWSVLVDELAGTVYESSFNATYCTYLPAITNERHACMLWGFEENIEHFDLMVDGTR